jgi:hypothetical protein
MKLKEDILGVTFVTLGVTFVPLGVTFVDPNSWIEDWDFGRDGLHINRSGARKLGQLYSRV